MITGMLADLYGGQKISGLMIMVADLVAGPKMSVYAGGRIPRVAGDGGE
jgi:hypothetical protein